MFKIYIYNNRNVAYFVESCFYYDHVSQFWYYKEATSLRAAKMYKKRQKKAKAHGEKFPYQKAGRQSRGKESSIGGCLVHLNGTFCFCFLL